MRVLLNDISYELKFFIHMCYNSVDMANSEELIKQVEQYEQDKKTGKKKTKRSVIKYILNISFVLIVTVLSIVLSTWGKWDTIWKNLVKADVRWLLAIIGVMAGTILIRSFILFCFARLYTRKYHFHSAIAVDQVGVFYNAVTPGASGGQIMQAYTYKKQGLHISSAVSALAMYSIVFQLVLIVYGILSFIMKYDLIMSIQAVSIKINEFTIEIPALILTIIGFLLNVSVILIVLLMAYWHGFHNFIMGPVISLLHKIKIVKHPDKSRENLRIQVENFKIEFRRLLTNIPFFILVAVCFSIYMTLKFSIPYFCGLALGNEHQGIKYFWDSVFLGNYHQMVTGLIPVPGSAGVSEYFFTKLFFNENNPAEGFFFISELTLGEKVPYASVSSSLTVSALLLWRSITFIIPITVAGITTAFYRASPKDEVNERGDIPNRRTFVALQKETYVMRKEEVDKLIETMTLSRKAILQKLKGNSKDKHKPEKKPKEDSKSPRSVEDSEYSTVDIKDEDDSI